MGTPAIDRLNEALAGRYRIERELGEGGMAIVYLAADLRHERNVALKVLKPELAAVVGADRFLAEIRTTANLQHPNILPLFDSGQTHGFLYYVMPYLEDESLRDRLDRQQQLPVEEAVRIATEVAEALQAAHEQGVIHRDIKPANILLSRGRPLVADFGIALAVSAAGGGRLTDTGLSLGTPSYMSPEQASGERTVDGRSDVYSLGCVLYEMLAGHPPFTGGTMQAVLVRVLTTRPGPVTEHRRSVPAHVDAVLQRALERIPADRFPSAAAFSAALADPSFRFGHGHTTSRAGPVAAAWRSPATWVLVLASVLVGALAGVMAVPERAAPPVIRYRLGFAEGQDPMDSPGRSIAISSDGARVVYVGAAEGGTQLWVRERYQLLSRPIPGTVGAVAPFFSPDNRRVGFVSADGALRVIALDGGSPLTLVPSGVMPHGAAWSEDGYVYFDRDDRVGLARVAARGGGAPEVVHDETLASGELWHGQPDPLPGGAAVLVTITRNHADNLVVAMDLETGAYRVLVEGRTARYARSGHLVYVEEDGSLLAAPFDARRLEITGPPVLIQELGSGFTSDLALSASGRLVYFVYPPPAFEVVWVDRTGQEIPLDPSNPVRGVRFLALSPDRSRLAVNTWTARPRDDGDIWVKQLPDGPLTRLTREGGVNFRPHWFPDSYTLAYISDRAENRDVWVQPVDGTAPARLLLDEEAVVDEAEISRDGSLLVYRSGMQDGERDLYYLRIGDDTEGTPIVASDFDETSPALSPDGRWLAYVSTVDGGANIYVRPFPEGLPRHRVSTNGGVGPAWARGGRELLYVSDADSMMSVAVDAGASLSLGSPTALFSTAAYRADFFHRAYDVTADGERFVMIRIFDTGPRRPELIVVENFLEELRQRVGA